ncbi:MAG: acylphosphatase [Sphingomonas sp.]|nr:acylphosphatase [Sphingomonas sp.]
MRRILVSGKVQKVGYRDFIVRCARDLRVAGWVRNLSDGRVELLVAGEGDAPDALIEAAREGPLQAQVTHVEVLPATGQQPKGFTKRFTV